MHATFSHEAIFHETSRLPRGGRPPLSKGIFQIATGLQYCRGPSQVTGRRIALIAILLLVMASRSAVSPVYGELADRVIACGSETNEFQICISLDKSVYSSLEPIILHVTISNLADRTRPIPVGRPELFYTITVSDGEGNEIPLTRYGKEAMQKSQVARERVSGIPSHEAYSESFIINRYHDLTQPGLYNVTVQRRLNILGAEIMLLVASEQLEFTVETEVPQAKDAWGSR